MCTLKLPSHSRGEKDCPVRAEIATDPGCGDELKFDGKPGAWRSHGSFAEQAHALLVTSPGSISESLYFYASAC